MGDVVLDTSSFAGRERVLNALGILAQPSDALSPRMVRILEDLAGDWRRLDERIEGLSNEIEAIARRDAAAIG